ncbi:MAG: LysR family transcriptional regulator [Myxococcota bacterium]
MKEPALETRDLRLMCALHEHGGVTRAASAMGLTQSAVSHHLARLQERLGATLVRRTGRGVTLTQQGEVLVRRGRAVLRQLSALEEALRGETRLAVCTQCHTAYDWLAPVLAHFEMEHPNARIDIRVNHSRDPIEALRHRHVDLALCHSAPGPGLVGHPLLVDPFVAVLPKDHPAAAGDTVSAADLVDGTVLVHDVPSAHLREVGALLFGDTPPSRSMRLPLTDTMLQLVAHGYGVAIMPGLAARGADARYPVVVRRFGKEEAVRRWRVVVREDDNDRADLETLVRAIVDWFA